MEQPEVREQFIERLSICSVERLRPHPLNARIYGDDADPALVASVREHGILEPLLVTVDGLVLSGHRRFAAARTCGHVTVHAVVIDEPDELAQQELLIQANRQRTKSNEQAAREAAALLEIERERAKRRHRGTVERAFQQARRDGHLGQVGAEERPFRFPSFTVAQWRRLPADEQQRHLCGPWPRGATFNDEGEQVGIGYVRWSNNPISGCAHDCKDWCYAKKITEQWPLYEHRFKPSFHPHMLRAFYDTPVPPQAAHDITYKNCFVVSMGDMLGEWVPNEWVEAIIRAMADNPRFNYLILTKSPERLPEFTWPRHCWLGTSIDVQERVAPAEQVFAQLQGMVDVLWISVEPMWEELTFKHLEYWDFLAMGGATPGPKTPAWYPPHRWIWQLEEAAEANGVKVYEKANLWRPWQGMPDDDRLHEATEPPAELRRYLGRHTGRAGGDVD
jgi:hypothetical protein